MRKRNYDQNTVPGICSLYWRLTAAGPESPISLVLIGSNLLLLAALNSITDTHLFSQIHLILTHHFLSFQVSLQLSFSRSYVIAVTSRLRDCNTRPICVVGKF